MFMFKNATYYGSFERAANGHDNSNLLQLIL